MEQVTSGRRCERCHADAAFGFGDTWLCEDCYGVVGSCCMEFDGDDLFLESGTWWESRIESKEGTSGAGPGRAATPGRAG